MAETADELSTPLGQKTARKKRRFRLPFTAMQALAVLLGLFLTGFASIALFTDNPLRRRAGGADRLAQDAWRGREGCASGGRAMPSRPEIRRQAGCGRRNKTVTIIDGSSGKRQDVVIGGDTAGDKTDADAAVATPDGRHRSAPAGEVALRHDPRGRRRPEAFHGLCRRRRPRQGGQNACGRHRRRRPRCRRRQDRRRHHEAAAGGDAGVHALRRRPHQARRTRPRAAPRDPAPGPDGAVRLSRQ